MRRNPIKTGFGRENFYVILSRNIVINSRMTPSWREIVSLTFNEAGVLHVNWTSLGHCVSHKGHLHLAINTNKEKVLEEVRFYSQDDDNPGKHKRATERVAAIKLFKTRTTKTYVLRASSLQRFETKFRVVRHDTASGGHERAETCCTTAHIEHEGGVSPRISPLEQDFLTRHILLRCDSLGDLYPVTSPSPTPHVLLSPIHQLDIKNAFLNGDLSETMYMYQPPGFVDARFPHHVSRLQRSLYRLKQAPCAWFQRLTDISYAVQQVCLHMHDPQEPHLAALKRVLRYVRGTLDFGL
uniref:Ribonuclease H-like domain-containing protein n=1 Tax=Tanacetum cinerariifolium TaxID=118510 RepID=A0A699HBK5_TANCI|nr:ribonuclease H-like domain-containing protein [Tanacetum cinerariifolium]